MRPNHWKLRWREGRDLRVLARGLSGSLFLPLAAIAAFVSSATAFETGIVQSEQSLQSMLKPDHSIVSVRSERLQGLSLRNTSDFFRELSLRLPSVDIVLSARAPATFSDVEKDAGRANLVSRDVFVLLVSDGFFDAVDGQAVTGRPFTRGEVHHGAPVALVTPGLLEDVTGSAKTAISRFFLNGLPIQVIGQWDFKRPNTLENHALIVPISLIPWLGDENRTRVGRLLLKGNEAAELGRLKRAMTRIQVESGQERVLPTFESIVPSASGKNQSLWAARRGILWMVARVLTVLAGLWAAIIWYFAHTRAPQSILWRESAGQKTFSISGRLFLNAFGNAAFWMILGAAIARGISALFWARRRHHFPFETDYQFWNGDFTLLVLAVALGLALATWLSVWGKSGRPATFP